MFAGRTENTDAVNFVKKMIYDAVVRRSSDVFIDPKNRHTDHTDAAIDNFCALLG